MIVGKLKHVQNNGEFSLLVMKALNHASSILNEKMIVGVHEIDGDRLYFNRINYLTTVKEERFWEAHRKYLDIHVILSGEERIDLNFIDNLEQGIYEETQDFLPLNGESQISVILKPGDFLICYPEDAHMTALRAGGASREIKKAVYKVIIE